MRQDCSIALFHYWNRLRDGRAAPRRTDVEPADIKTLLADTFILEKDVRGEAVFRLAGTRLCAIYGRELKGFSFPSLWAVKDQRMIARLVDGTFQAKSVAVITYEGVSRNGRRAMFELLLLPLDGGRENPRCMGSIVAAETPYWLGADPLIGSRVDTLRVIDPEREPTFLNNRPAMQVPPLVPGDASLESAAPAERGRRIRHLVVFEGGKEE